MICLYNNNNYEAFVVCTDSILCISLHNKTSQVNDFQVVANIIFDRDKDRASGSNQIKWISRNILNNNGDNW